MTGTQPAVHSAGKMIGGWIALSRLPFHLVGVIPFLLGTLLAFRLGQVFNLEIFLLGVAAVILIMLSTYHAGEYFDRKEDSISAGIHKNPFAGGSGVMPSGKMPPAVPLYTSVISLSAALAIGIILRFVYQTGPWTLALGFMGALPGFFYSTEPIRLVKRGVGELFIGFCFGWLPIAAACYIQAGTVFPVIHWISLPVGLSIFNVILLNEFPDYEADMISGKKNLLCRLGKEGGRTLYIAAALLVSITMLLSPFFGVPFKVVWFALPVVAIDLYCATTVKRNLYDDPGRLELLCGLTIVVNLGVSISYLLAYAL